jgi:hypothetical protein
MNFATTCTVQCAVSEHRSPSLTSATHYTWTYDSSSNLSLPYARPPRLICTRTHDSSSTVSLRCTRMGPFRSFRLVGRHLVAVARSTMTSHPDGRSPESRPIYELCAIGSRTAHHFYRGRLVGSPLVPMRTNWNVGVRGVWRIPT